MDILSPQLYRDLIQIVKNDRRYWYSSGFIVVCLTVWGLTHTPEPHRIRIYNPGTPSHPGSNRDEIRQDLIRSFAQDINAAKKERQEMHAVLYRTVNDIKDFKGRIGGVLEQVVDRVEHMGREIDELARALGRDWQQRPLDPKNTVIGPDGLSPVWWNEQPFLPPPPEPDPVRAVVITPGDSVLLRLLTGVNAPTDGTPYPVVFELSGEIRGPNGVAIDLGDARVIAAAQGSSVDGRVLFRLRQLAFSHPNGRRALVDIDGWIVGEDGKRGMQGKVIDKLGRFIVSSSALAAAQSLGERLEDRTSSVVQGGGGLVLTTQDVEHTVASAYSLAASNLARVLLNKYEAEIPVVEVYSGREVAAIFAQPAEIALLSEDLV